MVTPMPPARPSDTQAAVNGVAMQVTPENVLQARAALLKHAETLYDAAMGFKKHGKRLVGLCGGDPISQQAQAAFEVKIHDNAIAPALRFVAELHKGAEQLAQTARGFGMTEERIAASFKSGAHGVDPR